MKVFKYTKRKITVMKNNDLIDLRGWDPRPGDWKYKNHRIYGEG